MARGTSAQKFDFSLLRQTLAVVHGFGTLHHLLQQDVAIVGEDRAAGVVLLEGLGCGFAHLDGPVGVGNSGLKLKTNNY